jgi:hypothetical protein
MSNLLFVTLEGSPRGPLAAKTQGAQQVPDMAGVIVDSGQVSDQQGHARQRPQIGPIAMGERPLEQSGHHLLSLGSIEAGLSAGATFTGQPLAAGALPSAFPTARRLATHTEPPGDLGRTVTLIEHGCGAPPPPFQLRVISFDSHAEYLAQPSNRVTLFYETQ